MALNSFPSLASIWKELIFPTDKLLSKLSRKARKTFSQQLQHHNCSKNYTLSPLEFAHSFLVADVFIFVTRAGFVENNMTSKYVQTQAPVDDVMNKFS